MKTVVYADVLVVINIIVNYFLLRASAAVISFDFKAWRFLVSSVLGGTFSLIIFVDGLPAALLAAVKLLFLLLMVLAAFGYGSFKRFFKCCAAFLASNLAFAGLMLAGRTFLFPDSIVYKNSVVYFVVIAERRFIEALLPPEMRGDKLDITALHGFRLIPYTTVGGAGALPAFPADSVEIFCGEGRRVENIYIAVTEKRIVHGGYSALIGAPLFE